MEVKHTKTELAWFAAYEKVRQSGRFNMFDPRAREAARLTSQQYGYVMSNFDTLLTQSATKEPTNA